MHAIIDGEAQAGGNEWAPLPWEEFDEEPGRRRVGKLTMWIAAMVLVGSVGLAVQRTVRTDDAGRGSAADSGALSAGPPASAPPASATPAAAPGAIEASSPGADPQNATTSLPRAVPVLGVATSGDATHGATATTPPTTVAVTAAGTVAAPHDAVDPVAQGRPATSSIPVTSVAIPAASPVDPGASIASTPSSTPYTALPDGTPAPAIATFDVNTVTLTGVVPDEAAKDRLAALSAANSKTHVVIQNMLTIDARVPRTVGVRVIELTSSRFDEGSAAVHGAHAGELDRITTILNALPTVTALVIGHADQIGSSAANFKLSVERATAVVDYLVASGIDPGRLSARAVGESDLLSLNDDEASLALNRRTEIVFYGLFSS